MTNKNYPDISVKLLTADHETTPFSCGEASMDNWLKTRALRNQKLAATRTFAVTLANEKVVIGYYGLSMSEIIRSAAPKSTQRNMPESIPVVLLGRLAIDQSWQGKGLGLYLVQHLIQTALLASQTVAARMIITKPIDQSADQFYQAVGFEPLRGHADFLGIDLRKVRHFLDDQK